MMTYTFSPLSLKINLLSIGRIWFQSIQKLSSTNSKSGFISRGKRLDENQRWGQREERSRSFYTSARVAVIYLCKDHSSPGTRPMPSIRRRLSPSRCCAGSSPDAAAESLQTGEDDRWNGGEKGRTGKEKWIKRLGNILQIYIIKPNPRSTKNKPYHPFPCNQRKKTCSDRGARPPNYKSLMIPSQEWFIDAESSPFLSPLKPFWFVTRLEFEANDTPANH